MPPAASDTSHCNGERTAQNRRVPIHDNDQENMLVEAVTGPLGSERVEISEYFASWMDEGRKVRFILTLDDVKALHADLGRFLAKRPTLLTTAKAGERAA